MQDRRKNKINSLAPLGAATAALLLLAVFLPSLRDGLKLILNDIYARSEAAQAYKYIMLEISISPDGYARARMLAYLAIGVYGVCYAYTAARRRSGIMCFIPWVLLILAQVYFGVFLPAVWQIVLAIATISAAIYFGGASIRRMAAALFLIISVLAFSAAIYIGPNAQLGILSETLRDLFDEKIERPITAQMNPIFPENNETTPILDDTHGNAVDAANVDETEQFAGSQIGTSARPKIWILWLMLAAFPIMLIVWILYRVYKDKKRRDAFNSPDCRYAINEIFAYSFLLHRQMGLETKNGGYLQYAGQISALYPPEYLPHYLTALDIWHEAVYSGHEIDDDKRQNMLRYYDVTSEFVAKKLSRLDRAKMRLDIIFARERERQNA